MARFGVEEEFMVLDRRTLAPAPRGMAARAALHSEAVRTHQADAPVGGDSEAEFLDCQVEISTTPATTLADAALKLRGFRRALGEFARGADALICSAGTPYGSPRSTAVTPKERYRVIADLMGGLTQEHFVNGLHVHTEVAGAEDRIRALNALRPWLPVLLALTANSPFWRHQPSGFASWRSILLRRLSTMWCPPLFADADDYERRIDRLVATGAAIDRGSIAWAARVSDNYPTVEVRVFDAQLTTEDSLFAAALTRALVTEPPTAIALESEAIDASFWMAARAGMQARLVDPRTGEVAPATSIAEGLVRALRNSLDAHGDLEVVHARFGAIQSDGTGADLQLRALEEQGIAGLRRLFTAH